MKFVAPFVLCSILAISCKEADPSPPASAASIADQDQPVDVARKEGDKTASAAPLPAIDLKPVAAKVLAASRAQNEAGLEHQRKGDFERAILSYVAAINSDAGNLVARYNLATAYHRAGQTASALEILAAFKAEGCELCIGRLVRSQSDPDFESLKKDPSFLEIVGGAKATRVPLKQAVSSASRAIEAGKLSSIASMIHPRTDIAIDFEAAECDEDCVVRSEKATGLADLERVVGRDFAPSKVSSCRDDCCELQVERTERNLESLGIAKMCFQTDSGGVATLSRLVVSMGH